MAPADGPEWDWNVGVFCHNERARIGGCIAAIAQAASGRRTLVSLIANGSHDGSVEEASLAARTHALPMDVWTIAHADKSNAINRFFHDVMAPARTHFCVDGYVHVGPKSFTAMEAALAAHPEATAATGIAINGRTMHRATAETLAAGGRLHGQLYALSPRMIAGMRAQGLRLPVDLYRGDGLLGSMAAHALDAIGEKWVDSRIVGTADATYEIAALSPFRPNDIRRQFRRQVRQMRGRLETAAIKRVIYARNYAGLPDNADTMIAEHLASAPVPAVGLLERPFMEAALRAHRRAVMPEPGLLVAVRVG